MRISENDFKRIADFMLSNYGINFDNKIALINGRLSALATKSGFENMHEYIDYTLKDASGEEINKLVSKLTTNYTFFMREPQHYEYLQNTILPKLTAQNKVGTVRIWSAGCSSGEEPYSIALTLKRYFDTFAPGWNASILATDISDNMLARARAGIYEEAQVKTLDPLVRDKYFSKTPEGQYKISNDIKQMVRLEKFNLMGDFVKFYRKFDIIFCRNVMIYFKSDTKSALAGKFYDVLEPGGYFFIGLSESLYNLETRFKFVKPAIYQKQS